MTVIRTQPDKACSVSGNGRFLPLYKGVYMFYRTWVLRACVYIR